MLKKILFLFTMLYLSIVSTSALTSNDFEYVLENNEVKISGYHGTSKELILPNLIEGKIVTAIQPTAFARNTNITSVKIPNSIKYIYFSAFSGCTNLTTVDFGSGVEYIGETAFSDTKVSQVKLPDSLKRLDVSVFRNVKTLTTLHIPKKVETIDSNPSMGTEIKSFTVDALNTHFMAENGVLYSKDKTVLVAYPSAKIEDSFDVPTSVQVIGKHAFADANLKQISVKEGIKEIKSEAFYQTKIEKITLPKSLNWMDMSAFFKCPNLTEIIINGDLEEVMGRTFDQCEKLQKITFHGKISTINTLAFYYLPTLEEVTFTSVKKISENSFEECKNLELLHIPNDIEVLEKNIAGNQSISYNIPTNLTKMNDGSYRSIVNLILNEGTYNYDMAHEVVKIVNEERNKVGNASLVMDKTLTEKAMLRAKELAIFYSHDRPIWQTNLIDGAQGENIAVGSGSAKGVMNLWMDSPGHRYNLLMARYKSIGVGSFSHNGTVYWVQLFSTQEANKENISNVPKKVVNENLQVVKRFITNFSLSYEVPGSNGYFQDGKYRFFQNESYSVQSNSLLNASEDWKYGVRLNPSSYQYSSSNTNIFTVDNNGTITPRGIGEATLTVKIYGIEKNYSIAVSPKSSKNLVYQSNINGNWQDLKEEGITSGGAGEGKGIEQIRMYLTNTSQIGTLEYRSYIEGKGWESSWSSYGNPSGKVGKRIEAIQVRLLYNITLYYDIYYRVHVQKLGWLGWAKNGESAGTSGYDYRIEAIEVKMVDKYRSAPGSTQNAFMTKQKLSYQTQVQKKGWLDRVSNGNTSGTVGSGLRMETLKVTLENQEYTGNIEYRTHVQKKGWETTWKKNGESAGSVGEGLRLEAVQIRLTGEISKYYDIYYRIHSQRFGWLDWTKNGASAGTAGFGFRVEAIQIKLVKKGGSAPGKTTRPYVSYDGTGVTYQTHVQKNGWLPYVKNGVTSGTVGSGLRMETLRINLTNQGMSGNIEYRTHIQKQGWEKTWKKNGENSGTTGLGLRLEALQLRLTGKMATEYDIYYRVHAQKFGWLGWAKNGESAGTAGYGYRLEAIQIVLVRKGFAAPGSTENTYKVFN